MTQYKFPWTQFLISLLFYIIIAMAIYVVIGLLPRAVTVQSSDTTVQTATSDEAENQRIQQIYNQVLTAVGKHLVLPTSLPEISIINDVTAFTAQNPIFVGVSVGDIVLLYSDRMIVYSPQSDRVINQISLAPRQNSNNSISNLEQETTSPNNTQ